MTAALATAATAIGVLIALAAVLDLALRVVDRIIWRKGDRG